MEETDKHIKQTEKKNGVTNITNGFQHKPINFDFQNVTCIDLSSKNIDNLDTVQFPTNLLQLNLSHNKLNKVPAIVLNLNRLKILDLSSNQIKFFDDSPAFCHTLERLDLSNNNLKGPPYWVWAETAKNLTYLNISNNPQITQSFINGFFEELLTYTTNILELELYNCRFHKHTQLIGTCPKLRKLLLGCKDLRYMNCNSLQDAPCKGLDKCHDIETLNLCNTCIYTITPTIEVFNKIVEIDLSSNSLHCLPNEFCKLSNLKICILTSNKILYLPYDLPKLLKLEVLMLDDNELYSLPDLTDMNNLKTLDLYNNHFSEVPSYSQLEEFDVALNYLDEPNDDEYLEKKSKLRLLHENRYDGRKPEEEKPESICSSKSEPWDDDEECYQICLNNTQELDNKVEDSSDEDWDSDDYWIPCNMKHPTPPPESPWIYYVKRKMEEGYFCPMDAHKVSVAELVKFHKICYPEVIYESDGQFDDLSSDDS